EIATTLAPGITVTRTSEEALRGADVVVVLRIQKERLAGKKLSFEDYIARFQLTPERMRMAHKDAILMHPGPVIRGVEINGSLPDYPQSVILDQVRNGVPLRMAILARALGVR
ncbi:MAG: aspartate carbamoyltransferase, partial [Candidatus Korobacteraceae bacterium]